jgi:hypothetical protein
MSAANWLRSAPRKPPPEPKHVDLVHLIAAGNAMSKRGEPVPHIEYIKQFGPKIQTDEWGAPLPLSSVAQYDLDRLVAIMMDPLARARGLLLAGRLNPDEVTALKAVYPTVHAALVDACVMDMMQTKPPYQVWAQTVLGVLFQKPATQVYASSTEPGPSSPKQGGPVGMPGALPTPTDRMDPAVREQARS